MGQAGITAIGMGALSLIGSGGDVTLIGGTG